MHECEERVGEYVPRHLKHGPGGGEIAYDADRNGLQRRRRDAIAAGEIPELRCGRRRVFGRRNVDSLDESRQRAVVGGVVPVERDRDGGALRAHRAARRRGY